jgi:hypothetical protein
MPNTGCRCQMTSTPLQEENSTIETLFREWNRQFGIANTPGASDVADAAVDQLCILKNAMLAIPSTTLLDLATKLTVSSQGGWNDVDMKIVEEAQRIVNGVDVDATEKSVAGRLMDVEDKLFSVRSLNQIIFMAAADIQDPAKVQAIQTVTGIIDDKLLDVRDELDAIREGL